MSLSTPVMWCSVVLLAALTGWAVPTIVANDGAGRLALILAIAVSVVCARVTFGSVFLSPVQIVVWTLLALAILGPLAYAIVATVPGGAGVELVMSPELVSKTLDLYLVCTESVLVGSLLVAALVRVGSPTRVLPSSRAIRTAVATPFTLAACVVPLVALVVANGPGLWQRAYYLNSQVAFDAVAALAAPLSVGALIILGHLWGSRYNRLVVALLTCLTAVALFGTGSRLFAAIPAAFAAGNTAALSTRRSRVVLVLAAAATFFLIRVPLLLRTMPSHGVLPYARDLPDIIFHNTLHRGATSLNLLISFAISGETAFREPHFPLDDLWKSMNPLPGTVAGWYRIAPLHRLNINTPYAGIGELGNCGWLVVVVVSVAIGAVLGRLDISSRRLLADGLVMPALALVGLSALFAFLFVQYNLRSSLRMLYYGLALDVGILVWRAVRHGLDHRSRDRVRSAGVR